MNKKIEILKPHLAINVRNVGRSVEFYQKLFGIEPSKVRTGYAKFDVEQPSLNFTLNEVPFGERGALSHLGIQVSGTEDVLAMRELWRERGLLTRDEMNTNCCYAIQDKTWAHDPDGNEWEVFVVKEDNLAETEMCCVTDADGNTACAAPETAEIQNQTAITAVGDAPPIEPQTMKTRVGTCANPSSAKTTNEIQSGAARCC